MVKPHGSVTWGTVKGSCVTAGATAATACMGDTAAAAGKTAEAGRGCGCNCEPATASAAAAKTDRLD